MLSKKILGNIPPLKKRDIKKALEIKEIDVNNFPSQILNIIVEFLNPLDAEILKHTENMPPPKSTIELIKSFEPWIILTILGYSDNLLIKTEDTKIIVKHFNSRYSANKNGITYRFEAVGD